VSQGLLGDNFFQFTRFTAQGRHLAQWSRTGRISSKLTLTCFHKIFLPFVINTLGYAFYLAKLGDGFFTTQPVQHNADLFFS
jgi:hypothetical protein